MSVNSILGQQTYHLSDLIKDQLQLRGEGALRAEHTTHPTHPQSDQ